MYPSEPFPHFVDDYLAYPFPPLQLFSTLREHIPEAFGESRWH